MAEVFWLIGLQRNQFKDSAIDLGGYLNEMPSDEVLLLKDLFIPLMHSTYSCFNKTNNQDIAIPESYCA